MIRKLATIGVAGTIALAACSKSNSNPSNSTLQSMYGTWNVQSALVLGINPLTNATDTALYATNANGSIGTVTFNSNDSVVWTGIADTVLPYHVVNAQTFVQGGDTLHIQTLTKSEFSFSEQGNGYTETITLSANH